LGLFTSYTPVLQDFSKWQPDNDKGLCTHDFPALEELYNGDEPQRMGPHMIAFSILA
jgi:hypothetical protein